MKKVPGQEVDEAIHIDLAADITRALFNDEFTSQCPPLQDALRLICFLSNREREEEFVSTLQQATRTRHSRRRQAAYAEASYAQPSCSKPTRFMLHDSR